MSFFFNISQEDRLNLIKLALNNDVIIHNEKAYVQADGLSMGNPLAPQMAIIYMHFVEESILQKLPGILL